MTKTEAHRVLDAAQRGEPVTELQIICALRTTGDMAPLRLCSRLPEPVRSEPSRRVPEVA